MAKIKKTIAEPQLIELKDTSNSQRKKFLALNNQFARETSKLTSEEFDVMIDTAFAGFGIAPEIGFVLAFDQDADYQGAHFLSLKTRFDKFIYIDRVIVSKNHQSQGIGRALYEVLIELANEAKHETICCEVNLTPENPISIEFHEEMGFEAIEDVELESGKIVRYYSMQL